MPVRPNLRATRSTNGQSALRLRLVAQHCNIRAPVTGEGEVVSLDLVAFILKIAGILLLCGGITLSGISQSRFSAQQRHLSDARNAWQDRIMGHPEWTPPEQRYLADEYEKVLSRGKGPKND